MTFGVVFFISICGLGVATGIVALISEIAFVMQLEQRFPQTWRMLGSPSALAILNWRPGRALTFLLSHEYASLNDPMITRLGNRARRSLLVSVALWFFGFLLALLAYVAPYY